MKFSLYLLLLFGSLNLILARSIYWGPYHTHVSSIWPNYDYEDELFALPSRQNSEEKSDSDIISKLFGKSSENSKESTDTKLSNELNEDDEVNNLRATQLKDIDSLIRAVLGVDNSEEETQTDDQSKENSDEKGEKDNTAENNTDDDDDASNSQEQLPGKTKGSSEKNLTVDEDEDKNESKESSETVTTNNQSDEKKLVEHDDEISEQDIKELTAILLTISTLDDLMKIAETTSGDEELLKSEELNEKKFKEINDYLISFSSLLDKFLDESSEKDKETAKSKNDDDDDDNNDSKEDNNDDDKDNTNENKDDNNDDNNDDPEDSSQQDNNDNNASVSLEFHDIENSKTNLNNHKYDIIERSTNTASRFKPTSSPYMPETFSFNADNSNAIQEYVEIREKIDHLQDNLLANKLNMDKDFYNIIANDGDDKNMKMFANDIAVLRDNAYKMKQSIDDMQDIKTKLYFHKLIKAAVKEARF